MENSYAGSLARYYDVAYPYDAKSSLALIAFLRRKGIVPKNDWALDVGCGSGRISMKLLQAGWRVVGVDVSHEMLRLAAKRARRFVRDRRAKFVKTDITALSLKRTFGLAVAANGFFNQTQFSGSMVTFRRTVARIAAHLAPDGLFLIELLAAKSPSSFNFNLSVNQVGKFFYIRQLTRTVEDGVLGGIVQAHLFEKRRKNLYEYNKHVIHVRSLTVPDVADALAQAKFHDVLVVDMTKPHHGLDLPGSDHDLTLIAAKTKGALHGLSRSRIARGESAGWTHAPRA